jgi:hypothetical protein
VVRGDGVRRYGQGSVQAYGLGATRLSPRASSCTGSQSFLNEEPAPPSIAYLPRRRERPPELESGGGPPTPPIFYFYFLFRVGTFVLKEVVFQRTISAVWRVKRNIYHRTPPPRAGGGSSERETQAIKSRPHSQQKTELKVGQAPTDTNDLGEVALHTSRTFTRSHPHCHRRHHRRHRHRSRSRRRRRRRRRPGASGTDWR